MRKKIIMLIPMVMLCATMETGFALTINIHRANGLGNLEIDDFWINTCENPSYNNSYLTATKSVDDGVINFEMHGASNNNTQHCNAVWTTYVNDHINNSSTLSDSAFSFLVGFRGTVDTTGFLTVCGVWHSGFEWGWDCATSGHVVQGGRTGTGINYCYGANWMSDSTCESGAESFDIRATSPEFINSLEQAVVGMSVGGGWKSYLNSPGS